MVTINCPEDYMPGTAGKPLPECDVRIADDGEILVGGPNVMKGYYRTSGRSAEAFGEGWIRTGDIGELDNGYLRVLGRKMT
jgi:long-chain acyl-CoA synthetase